MPESMLKAAPQATIADNFLITDIYTDPTNVKDLVLGSVRDQRSAGQLGVKSQAHQASRAKSQVSSLKHLEDESPTLSLPVSAQPDMRPIEASTNPL